MPDLVIGCDPSSRAPAFAVHDPVEGTWLLRKFRVPKGDRLGDEELLKIGSWLRSIVGNPAHGYREVHFIAEDQYQSRAVDPKTGKPRNNPKTFKALCVARGQVEAAARLAGCTVHEPVAPSAWQSAILGSRRGTSRKQLKEAAKRRAHLLTGEEVKDSDLADAVGITAWLTHRTGRKVPA